MEAATPESAATPEGADSIAEASSVPTPSASTPESNPLERQVELEIDADALQKDVNGRLNRLSRKIKMPGFRRGKVPPRMIEQQYGREVYGEALGDFIDQSWREAVQTQNLKVAGHPRVEPKTSITSPPPGSKAPLVFIARYETYPEIKLADLSSLKIERPVLEVGEEEIARTLEVLRKQRVTYEAVERAAEAEDRVTVDFKGMLNGKPLDKASAEGFDFVLNGKQMLPDFEAAVIGLSAGEAKNFDLRFPENYTENPGELARFEVKVHKVEAPRLPEIDADFARQFGVSDGDVETMKADVEDNLRREVRHRIDTRVKEQVMDALLEAHAIDVPQALVEMESSRMLEQTRADMKSKSRGISGQSDHLRPGLFAEAAKRRVTLGLIVAELVEAHHLQATPEQVRARVEETASSYEDSDAVVRWYYNNQEGLAQVESLALEHNVVEWVLGQARVEDQAVDFEALMGKA